MATLASTQVTSHDALAQPVPVGGLHIEHWRVAMGAVGDTAAIAPKRGRFVVSVIGGMGTHTLGTLGTNTNVTLTLTSSAVTTENFDVQLYVAE
jgi:hypothetical protein